MTIVSSFLTFPNISWWKQVASADTLVFDAAEHFQKMGYRNRYRVAGANNSILLSIPLVNGRDQRLPMHDVLIHNEEHWQVQHWRTLVSVYKRSPYFEHFEDSLRPLYETQFLHLVDFNKAAFEWVKKQLKLDIEVQETSAFIKEYPPEIADLRNVKIDSANIPKYYQVFEDRVGFIPHLSILDLLFCEGPQATRMLKAG